MMETLRELWRDCPPMGRLCYFVVMPILAFIWAFAVAYLLAVTLL